MALHRDIYWVGRQWAVTGYGMQLLDQKLKGYFDIEASRLWEDALVESMKERPWLNAGDFDKALSVARARYKEPPKPEPPFQAAPPEPAASSVQEGAAIEPPKPEPAKPAPPQFAMQTNNWPARFVPPWRVRIR